MTSNKTIARWAAPLSLALAAVSMPASAFEPSGTECIAPAGAGGGWDMTCRLVGKTMQDMKLVPGTGGDGESYQYLIVFEGSGDQPVDALQRLGAAVADGKIAMSDSLGAPLWSGLFEEIPDASFAA